MKYRHLVLMLGLVALVACGGMETREGAGFLSDYSQLRPTPDVEGARAWRNPDKTLPVYHRFIIEPVVVRFAGNASAKDVEPEKLQQLTTYMRDQLIKELGRSGRNQVVTAPGPGVMRVRAAITDLKKNKPALNIHPATKIAGFGLGGASIEAEGIDTPTGKRVFAFMQTRTGNRLSFVPGLENWGHAQQAMDYWAELFAKRIEEQETRR